MSKRVISFELSEDGIEHAIREIERFKQDLIKACNELIRQLTGIGKEAALRYIASWTNGRTQQLEDSIEQDSKMFDEESRKGYVKTTCPYAALVEFGTGVEGDRMQHPDKDVVGWGYDSEGHHGDDGWWYKNPNDGHVYWTKGQPAKPFMWSAAIEVRYSVPDVTVKLFAGL